MHYIQAKSILSASNGMNLYRGCQHGCIYCDSRSLCYQMNHLFEDIEVKKNAIELLERTLKGKRHRYMIGTGSMTDPYMPLEADLRMTRRALEVIEKYGFGAAVLTKSDLVLRDLDVLGRINEQSKAVVQVTMTTFDEKLCRLVEPNVCTTRRRFDTLCRFRDAGIPTVVWLSPLLPFLNDTPENLEGILEYCIQAGVRGIICFGMGLTLRDGSREYFYRHLDRSFPGLKNEYIRLYGNRYELPSPRSRELWELFHKTCDKACIMHDNESIFRYLHTYPDRDMDAQLRLF